MRFFSILAAFLVISLSLLFLNRLPITEKLLAGRIEAIGGSNIQVTVSTLSSNELTVTSLAATFPEDSSVQSIQLRDLTLSFSFSDLLKGKVAGLKIAGLQIKLGKKKQKSETTFSYQTLHELLEPRELPPFLPTTMVIQDLVLSGPGAVFLAGKSLRVTTRFQDSGLSATLQSQEQQIKIEAELQRLKNGAVQLQVSAHQAATPFFHLSLQHADTETAGKLTSLLDSFSTLSPLLPDITGDLEVTFVATNTHDTPLAIELGISSQDLSFQGWHLGSLTSDLILATDNFETLTLEQGSHIAVSDIQGPALGLDALQFHFSGRVMRIEEQLSLSLAQDSRLVIHGLSQARLQLKQAAITPALTFTHNLQGTQLNLHPEFTATIQELQAGKLSVPEIRLSPEAALLLARPTDSTQNWTVNPGKVLIAMTELQFQEMKIKPALLSLEIKDSGQIPSPSQLHILLTSKEMVVQRKKASVPLQDIQLDLTRNRSKLTLNGSFSHAKIPGRIEGKAIHDVTNATGKARFSTVQALDLGGEETELKQLVDGLQLPFSLSSGLVNCAVNMEWEKGVPRFINSSFELSEGIGGYKNAIWNSLNIQQELQLFPKLQTLGPGYIFIGELNGGLSITNIEIRNQLVPGPAGGLPILLLDSIEGELLKGRISSNAIRLDPSRMEVDFAVQLNGLSVEEVIKLIKMDGLSVTGIIDGTIPIQIRNRQIHVTDGELHSRAPGGTINYLPPGGISAGPYLPEYVMQALEEFNYDTLIATPIYEPDGNLILTFQIKGQSPKLSTSRPIHLNLSTEQNLLSLLQSLRYTKALTDDLEKQIQTRHPTD